MSLVQAIVVKPASHCDTIAAVALASGLAMVNADLSTDPWYTWLQGSFTKSVRRIKRPIELERVRELPLPSTETTVGDAVAISFAPQRYEDSPSAISRLQVSGLDLPREFSGFRKPGAVTPHIEINADVTMSTGKTAAQVSHALGAWLLAQPFSTRMIWANTPGLSISEISFAGYEGAHALRDDSSITILDNGLTEIAPDTATARVQLVELEVLEALV